MKFWCLLTLILAYSWVNGQDITGLHYFFEADSDERIKEFVKYSERAKGESICASALYGTAQTMSASLGYNPISKLERFAEGKKLLEQIHATNECDPCIHFCRLAVQVKAPGFLNYNEHIKSDAVIVIESLKENWLIEYTELRQQVITFLRTEVDLTSTEQARLEKL